MLGSLIVLLFSEHLAVTKLRSISLLLLFCTSRTNPATFLIVSNNSIFREEQAEVKTLKEQRSC